MPVSALERFKRRLVVVGYFRHRFGVKDIHDLRSVRAYYTALNEVPDGYDAEGRSYVHSFLKGRTRAVDEANLLRYDANIRGHVETLNRHRTDPITLKYFQVLAALCTEFYLDQATRDPAGLLAGINAFAAEQNRAHAGRIEYPLLASSDLNKLAYWMATGSGKTLLMHLNYYQYLHYRPDSAENILLVTPNEGLSVQHMAEMEQSGIPCRRFDAGAGDLFSGVPNQVQVIEITKLVEEKTGSGVSVAVSSFEGRNLVFVDEGHKGAASEAQTWRNRRNALAADGFTFEYSATFGQAIGAAGAAALEEEYGKAILFDYAYPRFYEDGYGKDYRILNLEHDFDTDLTRRYLLANLLTFYEQLSCYAGDTETFADEYNIAPPLQIFVGHSVTAGKTQSQLSRNDKQSLSDVQELVWFLHAVLRNEDNWVPAAIEAILSGKSGLAREDGADLFADAFPTLRVGSGPDGAALYADLLQRIFHVNTATGLHLVNLRAAGGEIGLRAGATDRYFGLINIGDDANFLKLVEQRLPDIVIEQEQFSRSLFQAINWQDSPINILLGAKKFIEGWDSWRVSTMGLMNIGRGEGPEIIQLFGRGVRLLGKDRTLKRSTRLDLETAPPQTLPLLETLNIFGVRASYIAQFRDYLAEEGIDTEERTILSIPTRTNEAFLGKGLLVIRPALEATFEESVYLCLAADPQYAPEINLMLGVHALVSDELVRESPTPYQTAPAERTLPDTVLSMLDWNRLYHDVWQYRTGRGYGNLVLARDVLQQILAEGCYRLFGPPDLLAVRRFADLAQIERIVLMILCKYVEGFYTQARRRWEQQQLQYQLLDHTDGTLVDRYDAHVKRSAHDFLQELERMRDAPALYENGAGLPERVHFDRHLYLPLLVADAGDVVKYTPPGLNQGERDFVEKLRDYAARDEGREILKDWEVFLLRNQSRGHGVGFLVGVQKYFPDFILWLQGRDVQHIVFIDPHGLLMGGDLDVNPKVQFYRDIKDYESVLNRRAGRTDIVLHAYIVSQTAFADLQRQTRYASRREFNQAHIYFREQDGYIVALLQEVLTGTNEV